MRARRRGITLLELLVVAGLVALLLAILVPALAAGRRASMLAAIAAHQRSVMAILVQYTDDHDSFVPYWGVPGTTIAPLLDASGEVVRQGHWSHPYFWGFFLQVQGYDGWQSAITPAGPMAVRGDQIDRNGVWTSLHFLTPTAYASPAFWTVDGEQSESMLRGMRLSEVRFASDKAILLMAETGAPGSEDGNILSPPGRRWSLAFADGHVEMIRVADLRPGLHRPPEFDGTPFFETIDGFHGRDK